MKALGLFAARLIVSALPFICAFPAQAADYSGLPITRILFKDELGNPWPDQGRLLPLIVAKQGSPFSRGDIRQGIEYLYLKGMFRDIRAEAFPEDGGVRLEYTLFPVMIVEKIIIEGNHAMSTSRLKDILGRTGGREYREEKLPDLRRDVLSLYETEGYFDADVEFRAVPADLPRRVVLRAIIAESEPTVIEDIRFAGNTAFSEKELRSGLESR
jgi:outer membrane protein insertion porin family